MHPWITSKEPGSCTICGMALVPASDGKEGKSVGENVISLSQNSVNVLGVATVPVRRMEMTKSLRFSGILEDDANLHRVVAPFYDGRIEKVYIQHVGEFVKKDQPLASIYSPELLYVVREYQDAVARRGESAVRNAAQRLIQYGLSPNQVAELAKMPASDFSIELRAPISGTVLTRAAYEGQYVKKGEALFEMGNLARLWFHAEVYERDLPFIRIGQTASIRSPSVPGRDFQGVVTFIDPNFDPQTRSTKVRIEVDNPLAEDAGKGMRRMLPHGAYAEAVVHADLGTALVAPRSAVLRDGRRSVVYVETSPGAYEQRSVTVGRIGDEGIEILEGVRAGEKVVVEGNLLIDAEAQLRHVAGAPKATPSPAVAVSGPLQKEAGAFLAALAQVSEALAADDAVAAARAGQHLPELAAAIPELKNSEVNEAVARLQKLRDKPTGSDIQALRGAFLPWSQAGAALALSLERAGRPVDVRVFECPMTGDSFPGAPNSARWVQMGRETHNPYFGNVMPNCGAEVPP